MDAVEKVLEQMKGMEQESRAELVALLGEFCAAVRRYGIVAAMGRLAGSAKGYGALVRYVGTLCGAAPARLVENPQPDILERAESALMRLFEALTEGEADVREDGNDAGEEKKAEDAA